MAFEIEYFHERVLAEIEIWPARLLELLTEHGPNLRLPHSRAMGDGLFELRPPGGAQALAGRSIVFCSAGASWCCTRSSRRRRRRPNAN